MGKVYEYFITDNLNALLRQRIKLKSHLIEILIEACSLILVNVKPKDIGLGSFKIKIDKMGRIFFDVTNKTGEKKFFSFNFPFSIKEEGERLVLNSVTNRILIDSAHLAILRSIVASEGFNETASIYGILLDFSQLVEESIKSLGLSLEEYERNIDRLLLELFTFEPGYIRYDFDGENQDGDLHPLYHIDIFYSQRNTFKLGFKKNITQDIFIDLLDTRTNCKYLSD